MGLIREEVASEVVPREVEEESSVQRTLARCLEPPTEKELPGVGTDPYCFPESIERSGPLLWSW